MPISLYAVLQRWMAMARQGWSFSETEVRRIIYLLSETSLLTGDIAKRMGCSKSAIISINRRFQVRDYGNHRNTWTVRTENTASLRAEGHELISTGEASG